MEIVEEIIREISDLTLKGALTYLVGHGIHDFCKKGYEKIKKIIQDKYNEGKYAFVPDKKEVTALLELKDNPAYKAISLLIPDYIYIDLIRTGMLINNYQESKKNRLRVGKIKNQIINRPNGDYLLKIANLPTTPFFSVIVDYMYELRKEGYSGSPLEEKFSEIVNLWEGNSLFVESETSTRKIKSFIQNQVKESKPFLFVLGMMSAGEKVKKIFNKLIDEEFFGKANYELKITETEPKKTEVMVYKKI